MSHLQGKEFQIMKKVSILLISLLAVFILASCGNKRAAENISAGTTAGRNDSVSGDGSQTAAENQSQDSSGKVSQTVSPQSGSSKVLIAYFSVPEDVEPSGTDAVAGASVVVSDGEKLGNTEYVAQLIQKTVGGELFRIETAESYPVDHDPLVDQAAAEQDDNARPELSSHVENFDQYETILLGYPNWWGDMPMPVYSFLEEYDFGAKTVIPFVTHGGSGASRTIETITELQPGALLSDNALVLSRNEVASSEEEVTAWAEGLELSPLSALSKMD